MKDGASNTVMLAEVRAGIKSFDPRGTWAMSGGSSALWAHGYGGTTDDYGPNNVSEVRADDVMGCSAILSSFGGLGSLQSQLQGQQQALQKLGMPCYSDSTSSAQQTARSMHANGVYASLCDGSVIWISDFIECSHQGYPNTSAWERLMARSFQERPFSWSSLQKLRSSLLEHFNEKCQIVTSPRMSRFYFL